MFMQILLFSNKNYLVVIILDTTSTNLNYIAKIDQTQRTQTFLIILLT